MSFITYNFKLMHCEKKYQWQEDLTTWIEWTPAATLKQKAPFASTEVDIDRVAIDAPSVCRIILRPFNCETIETSYYGMLIAKIGLHEERNIVIVC